MTTDDTAQPAASDFTMVAPGALAYMVTTGTWRFSPGDPSGLTSKDPSKDFHTTTDGPYSSYAMAERAADIRIKNIRDGIVTASEQMEPYGIGGHRGPHGNVSTWKRDLIWHDFTGAFGDQSGWQIIQIEKVDVLP